MLAACRFCSDGIDYLQGLPAPQGHDDVRVLGIFTMALTQKNRLQTVFLYSRTAFQTKTVFHSLQFMIDSLSWYGSSKPLPGPRRALRQPAPTLGPCLPPG